MKKKLKTKIENVNVTKTTSKHILRFLLKAAMAGTNSELISAIVDQMNFLQDRITIVNNTLDAMQKEIDELKRLNNGD